MRILVGAGLVLGMLHSAAAHAWDLDQLMQRLARVQQGRASFVERKYLAILDKPIESSGELVYVAPDHLEKRTLKPQPESIVLERDTLTIERDKKKQVLKITDYPVIAAFIDSIRGTLAGDRTALERAYRLFLGGSPERWQLILLPSDSEMAASIRRITILGQRDTVSSIEIEQADGDRSLMSIQPLAGQ